MRLQRKVAVITGGARGIGGATAQLFAREGARVVIGDVLADEGETTAAAIRAASGEALFVRTDVTRETECAALMAAAVDRYGRLDALVCCAGVLRGAFLQPEELDADTFASVLDINVKGTYLAVRTAVPWLRKAGGGVVLLLASGAGVRGPSSSLAYGASKGGVHGLAMTLEPRLAPAGIRVHDICPGGIATRMKLDNVADGARHAGASVEQALARAEQSLGDPAGVASILAFLASDEADFVRGTIHTR
jgi:NAD(P)-dependent dehydrogenase (short-subunit alcohol dehydrogenase family)